MAAGTTYTPIATTTLGSTTASYTFTSIPSTYTDLVLVVSGTSTAGDAVCFQLNGDSSAGYSATNMVGDGSTAYSQRATSNTFSYTGGIGTVMGTVITHFMNYSNTTTYKTFIARSSVSNSVVISTVSRWPSTAAINSIKVLLTGNSFASGTAITLYGIKAA